MIASCAGKGCVFVSAEAAKENLALYQYRSPSSDDAVSAGNTVLNRA
jgi:hypothetical protein